MKDTGWHQSWSEEVARTAESEEAGSLRAQGGAWARAGTAQGFGGSPQTGTAEPFLVSKEKPHSSKAHKTDLMLAIHLVLIFAFYFILLLVEILVELRLRFVHPAEMMNLDLLIFFFKQFLYQLELSS